MTDIAVHLVEEHVLSAVKNFEWIVSLPDDEVTDPFWRSTRSLYQSLPPERRKHLSDCFLQAAIDRVSVLIFAADEFMDSGPAGEALADALTRDGVQHVGMWHDYFMAECEERFPHLRG